MEQPNTELNPPPLPQPLTTQQSENSFPFFKVALILIGILLSFSLLYLGYQFSQSKKTTISCGGIAGLKCPPGYNCKLEGNFPDAMGTCIKPLFGGKVTLPPTPTPLSRDSEGILRDDPTANWKTYTNKSMDFSIKYPNNIVLRKESSASALFVLKEEGNLEEPGFKIDLQILFRGLAGTDPARALKSETPGGPACVNAPLGSSCNPRTEKIQFSNTVGLSVINDPNSIDYYVTDLNRKSPVLRILLMIINTNTDPQIINQFKQVVSTFKFLDQSQTDISSGWQTFTSPCNLTVKYPQLWNARTSFIPNAEKSGDPKYNYDCAYITAPDYTQGTDSREGLYVSISGTTIGTTSKPVDTKISPYSINTIDDYIKSVEDSVITEPEPFKAKNVQTKTYGTITGKYYETAAFEEHADFVFIKGNTIFNISWPKNYNGQYKNNIESIINSAQ